MPGEGDTLIPGFKMLREKLNTEAMKQLMDTAVASRGGTSNTELDPVEMPAMPPEVIGVRHVAVTKEAV